MKNKDKRYPVAIDDLLIEFDEMDYCPMNLIRTRFVARRKERDRTRGGRRVRPKDKRRSSGLFV